MVPSHTKGRRASKRATAPRCSIATGTTTTTDAATAAAAGADSAAAAVGSYHQQIEEFRRRLVLSAIRAAGGQHAEAARRLGISRQALSYLVRQLGLR